MLEIPGYDYDAAKKKYFKIEKSHTAPSEASWSADSVKRRRLDDASREEAQRRADLVRRHVKRHGLGKDIVRGGLLSREMDRGAGPAEDGRGRMADGDIGCAAWADGVADKGEIPFVPSFARLRSANLSCFWVGGDVAYATLDEETLVGTYLSTDENNRITFGKDPFTGEPSRTPQFRAEMIRCPQMSSITYHEPTHRMLLTSRESTSRESYHSCGLYSFSPPVEGEAPDQRWLLGETNEYQQLSIGHRCRDAWLVHTCTPAPASSDLLCVVGTSAGMLSVRTDDAMTWIAPEDRRRLPQEIFDVDFQQSNHNVLLAGGRRPRLWITDLRTPEPERTCIRHASSIAHLRSINPHQVLVAGLENTMSLYDMRFFGEQSNGNGRRPLLSFPGYKNAAHFHTGWDVCTEAGVAAAAQDDGTVKLFSLETGRTVRSPALDKIRTDTPVRALMFSTMGGERMPSLWVGEGQALRKFSLGGAAL